MTIRRMTAVRTVPDRLGILDRMRASMDVWEVTCDDCGKSEHYEYDPATGVPDLPFWWIETGEGRHRGRCCRTKRSMDKQRRTIIRNAVSELRKIGLNNKQLRAAGLIGSNQP